MQSTRISKTVPRSYNITSTTPRRKLGLYCKFSAYKKQLLCCWLQLRQWQSRYQWQMLQHQLLLISARSLRDNAAKTAPLVWSTFCLTQLRASAFLGSLTPTVQQVGLRIFLVFYHVLYNLMRLNYNERMDGRTDWRSNERKNEWTSERINWLTRGRVRARSPAFSWVHCPHPTSPYPLLFSAPTATLFLRRV